MTTGLAGPASARPTRVDREWTFYATTLLAFVLCAGITRYACRSMSGGMAMPGGWTMSMAWMRMPGQSSAAAAAMFLGMWLVMMIAMMLPSAFPVLTSYRRSLRAAGQSRLGIPTVSMSSGYFFVWEIAGVVAYVLGLAFAGATMRWSSLSRAVPTLSGAAIMVAGGIQLTSWKRDRLSCCRAPALGTPARQSPEGWRAAWNRGIRFGAHCGACCSGFMLLLLTLGVMDLGVMVIVGAAITLERVLPRPELAVRVSGAALMAIGTVLLVRSLIALGVPS